jgi:hypothetical protein
MLITRGFVFPSRYFPDILGAVAFSKNFHTTDPHITEIARVACSIIITGKAKVFLIFLKFE